MNVPQPCARRAHRHPLKWQFNWYISNITECTFPNPAVEGSTETPQLTYIPKLLAGNIQYQYISSNMHICIGCCKHQLLVLEIYHINKWGIHVSWGVSLMGNVHFKYIIYLYWMWMSEFWRKVMNVLGDKRPRWWTSEFCNGVMNVWGDERLNSVRGWWMS